MWKAMKDVRNPDHGLERAKNVAVLNSIVGRTQNATLPIKIQKGGVVSVFHTKK